MARGVPKIDIAGPTINITNSNSKAEIELLRVQLKQAQSEAEQLANDLSWAKMEVEELEEANRRLASSSGMDVLQKQVNSLTAGTKRAADEFKAFLQTYNLIDGKDNNFEQFRTLYESIKSGATTVNEAIVRVRTEFGEFFKEAGSGFDPQSLTAFISKLEEILSVVNQVNESIIRLQNGGITVSAATGSGEAASQLERLETALGEVSEEARAAYEPVTNLLRELIDFSNVDDAKLKSISNTLFNISQIGSGNFSSKSVDNILRLVTSLRSLPSDGGSLRLNFNFDSLNNLSVKKASVTNLLSLIEGVNNADIGKLEQLSHVDLTKFNDLNIKKSAVDNLKELSTVMLGGFSYEDLVRNLQEVNQLLQTVAGSMREVQTSSPETVANPMLNGEAQQNIRGASEELRRVADVYGEISAYTNADDRGLARQQLVNMGLSAEEAKAVADKFAEMKVDIDKVRLTIDESGVSGERLVNMTVRGTNTLGQAVDYMVHFAYAAGEAEGEVEVTAERSKTLTQTFERSSTSLNKMVSMQTRLTNLLNSHSDHQQFLPDYEEAARALEILTSEINRLQAAGLGSTEVTYDANASSAIEAAANAYNRVQSEVNAAKASIDAYTEAQKAAAKEAKNNTVLTAGMPEYTKALDDVNKEIDTVTTNLQKWTAAQSGMSSEAYSDLQGMIARYNELAEKVRTGKVTQQEFRAELKKLNDDQKAYSNTIKDAGENTKSWGDRLKDAWSKFSVFFSATRIFMTVIRGFKQMVSNVRELDDELTQLQIVTKESDKVMSDFADNMLDSAKELGVAATDLINAATTYARLGYSLDESGTLAQLTTMLQNVGDIDASKAQDAVTSIIKAFDIDVSNVEDVMDKLVETGNNFPISVSQLADGMTNASSQLAAAGNTFEQTVALLTAANTTLQNASKSSTGLRTITARLRNTKTELDELGEVMTEANYEELVQALTKHKVALTDVNKEYRSTYDIIKDIADQWDTMTSGEQAALATALSGNRQQQVFYSLIENFKEAEGAMASMADSGGALSTAYDTYLDSITAHINQLKASFVELSTDFINSDLFKSGVDVVTRLVEVVDTLVRHFWAFITVFEVFRGGKEILAIVSGLTRLTGVFQKLFTALGSGQTLLASITLAFPRLGAAISGLVGNISSLGARLKENIALLAAAEPQVWALIAVIGVLAITLGSVIYTAVQKSKEFEKAIKTVTETTEAVENTKKELASLQAQIDELNSYPLSIEGKNQLAELTNQSKVLTAQLKAQEAAQRAAIQTAATLSAQKLNNDNYYSYVDIDERGNKVQSGLGMIDTFKLYQSEIDRWQADFDAAIEAGKTKRAQGIAKAISDLRNGDMADLMDEIVQLYDTIAQASGFETEKAALNEFFNWYTTAVADAIDDTDQLVKEQEKMAELSGLSETIEAYRSNQAILESAMSEMGTAGTGGISEDTIKALAKETENYLDYLYVENGVIKMNTEAWEEYTRAQAESNLLALQQERVILLQEQAELQQRINDLDYGDYVASGDVEALGQVRSRLEEIGAELEANAAKTDLYSAAFDSLTGRLSTFELAKNNFVQINDYISDTVSSYTTLANLQQDVANGFTMSLDKAREYAAVYPEILNGAQVAADGQIILNDDVVNSFITGKQAELQANTDAKIAELEAEKVTNDAKIAFYQAQLDLAAAVANGELEISEEEAIERLNLSNDLVSQLIANGYDEAEAYRTVTEAMAGNTNALDRVAAAVAQNIGSNMANASSNMASNMGANANSAMAALYKIAQQAQEAAKAVKGIASGSVAGTRIAGTSGTGTKASTTTKAIAMTDTGTGGGTAAYRKYAAAVKYSASASGSARYGSYGTSGTTFNGVDATTSTFTNKTLQNLVNNIQSNLQSALSANANITGQIATLKALANTDLKKYANSGSGSGSGGKGGSGGSGGSGSGSGSSTDAEEEIENWFKLQYALHQHLMEMDQEDVDEYLGWLVWAHEKAYDEELITLDEWYKYQEEIYQKLHELFMDYLNDIEHEISMREHFEGETKKIISLYEEMLASIEKEIQNARSQGLDDTDEYIQSLQDKWMSYSDSIKDLREETQKSAKDSVQDLVDIRIKMLKQDIQNQKDAIKQQLSVLKDFYQKQKDMLQDVYDEEQYLESQQEKRKAVADIQAQIAQLEYDNSAWAQKRRLELAEELADAQKELDDFEKQHALETAQDQLDALYELQEERLNAQTELLEAQEDDTKGLYEQALEDIRNGSVDLYNEMIEWNNVYGDGLESTITEAWETAYKALQDYKDLFGELYEQIKLANATGWAPDTGGWDSHVINGGVSASTGNKTGTTSSAMANSASSSTSTSTATTSSATKASTKSSASTSSSSSTSSVTLTDAIKKSVAAAIWNGSFGWGSGKDRVNRLTEVFGANNGIQALVNQDVGKNGPKPSSDYTYLNMRKKFKGYASGTLWASPGIHAIDEEGSETIFESSDGTRYKMFSGGEKVLDAKASRFLYEFANSGGEVFKKIFDGLTGDSVHKNIQPIVYQNDIRLGDIVIEGNCDKATVSEIRRAQRESVEFMLKSFNRLNK